MKTPYVFQDYAINWRRAAREERGGVSLLCLEQGLGKTLVLAQSLDRLPVTLACPAFLQYNWFDEILDVGLRPVIVKSQADLFCKADVFIMSFHFLTQLDLDVVKAKHFAVDEFHYAKNLEAKRTQAVIAEIECVEEISLLSGTPIPSRPVELYPVLDALGIYERGYYSYVYRFCAAKKTSYGLDVNGASNLGQLRDLIKPYMLRFTKKQVLPQLPEKTYRVLSQDLVLPPEEKQYSIEDFRHVSPDIAFETMSTVMRLHAAIKYPVVTEIVDFYLETEDKLIVFGHHREEMLNPLIQRYTDAGMNPAYILGGMNPAAKKKHEKKFQEDPSCRIIVIGLMAGGVGLTLTAASRVILAESSWVPGDIDQAADRAHRISQMLPVFVDIITIRGSIDEYQVRRALEKLEVTSQLLEESDMPNQTKIKAKLESLRAIADDIDALLDDEGEEEEEEPTTRTRRGRGKAAAEEKPTRTRRRRGKAAEDEGEEEEGEEEEPKPTRTRRGRGKAAAEEKPTRTRRGRGKAAAEDEGEEEEEPKPTRRRRAKAADKPEKKDPFDDVRLKASEVMKETSRAVLSEILADFDAEKVSDLDEADYEEFIKVCDEELEAA